jgi:dipicolinate synthase subunit A
LIKRRIYYIIITKLLIRLIRGGDAVGQTYDFAAAVVGGDSRQIEVAKALTDLFKEVRIYGHPPTEAPAALIFGSSLDELVSARVILLPINGMSETGLVTGYKLDQTINFGSLIPSLAKGTLIVTGSMPLRWLQKSNSLQLKVLQYSNDDEIAILNSIPTAEGALQIAMEQLPITIHNSTVIVTGFGRVGMTVARVFKALGARTIVAARRPASLARAWEQGYERINLGSLAEIIGSTDIIINTVPVLILDATLIAKLPSRTLIIDLASPPYGTDFEAARRLNIKAVIAPGLPGKVAPKTAGFILSSIIPRLILEYLSGGDQ